MSDTTTEIRAVKLAPTRTRINPISPDGAPILEEGDTIFVVLNGRDKHRAIITADASALAIDEDITSSRFGALVVTGVRYADGTVEGDVPDASLPVRVFRA
jgi:hypothetical protein